MTILSTLPENLALDETLLLHAEEHGRESLRLWEWPAHAVVLGAGGKLADDVDERACRADGVPIYRRSSGGGAVLLGPGCLLFSLVLAYERDPALGQVVPSFRYVMQRMGQALAPLAPGITLEGTSDLAWNGLKISGNSQQRKRRFLLHHGTLLYDFDLERIPRYLKMPQRQPEYREGRPHLDFLTNLRAPREELAGSIRNAWDVPVVQEIEPEIRERVGALVREKYGRREWTHRR